MGSTTWMNLMFIIFLTDGVHCQRPVVKIPDGTLVGTTMATISGRNISAFLGIPYAEPPTGRLRFMPPVPNQPWEGVRDAGSFPPVCTQEHKYGLGSPSYFGQEDCLYLNVFRPKHPRGPTRLLPVLLYIHWGGFSFGSGNFEGPRYLLDYDLIMVNFNYRLSVLGFLTTETAEMPGNAGMLDQVLAMRWVQKNIAFFGGNPNDVTLAGTSAGSVSVHMHMLSPMSRGLYHRTIMQSGVATVPFALQKQPRRKFLHMANLFGCLRNTNTEMIACLQQVPAMELIVAIGTMQTFYYTPILTFAPTVQYELPDAFLPESPYEMVRNGLIAKVPALFSTVTNEGLFPLAVFAANETGLEYLNEHWNEVAPNLLDYVWSIDAENLDSTSQTIRNFYFGDKPVSRETINNLIRMVSDRLYVDDICTSTRWAAHFNTEPVYLYRFGYRGSDSTTVFLSGTDINWGASHPDDCFYILNTTLIGMESTPRDREMVAIMTGIWGNFVTRGVPVTGNGIPLEPIDRSNALDGPLNFLWIDSPSYIVQNSSYTFGHPTFWNSLPINEPYFGRPLNIYL